MHPLLRILDLSVGAGTQSSVHDLHPIRDGASARSRGLPLTLSLGMTPLLIYGLSLSLIPPSSGSSVQAAFGQSHRAVSIFLSESDSFGVKSPPRKLFAADELAGAGHREGMGTLNSQFTAYTSYLSEPCNPIDPDERANSIIGEQASLSLSPALPPHFGGNGLASGIGGSSARGSWQLTRPPSKGSSVLDPVGLRQTGAKAAVPDFKLVATRQIPMTYQMALGEEYLLGQVTQVRVLISENGVPSQATWISGPEKLQEKAKRAALGWRFEPLGPHGLRAPLALVLTFRVGPNSR